MAISKTQRWLDLIAFLVKQRLPVDVEQIMLAVPAYRQKWLTEDDTARATVRRMFERDKDELRAAGIPLETVPFTIDYGAETLLGYRLAGRDFYLPYLRIIGGTAPVSPAPGTGAVEVQLTPEEAALAIDALRRVRDLPASPFAAEARSALAKLTFDLDPAALGEGAPPGKEVAGAGPQAEARPGARAGAKDVVAEPPRDFDAGQVLYLDASGTGGLRDLLRLLTDAVRDRRRVRFRYHGIHRGAPTDRDVAPYGLLYQHGHWYLIGDDATRGAIRVFRLGRMEAAAVGRGDAPEYDVPADFDVSAYARREPWELGEEEPLACDVRFEFPLSLWAERNGHGRAVRELPGGAVVRRFEVRQTDPLLRWLQSFAGDAVVVSPPELRRAQVELARETLGVHGG